MHPLVTNRSVLLKVTRESVRQLADPSQLRHVVTIGRRSSEPRFQLAEDESFFLVRDLDEAIEWAEKEDALNPVAPDAREGVHPVPYIPSNQVLSLVQSAMEEYLNTRDEDKPAVREDFDTSDPKWLSSLWEMLKARFRRPARFVSHKHVTDFRFGLAPRATVALVSDWGTGTEHAVRVAEQIRALVPDHFIHLGDVYYSGTKPEVQSRFLDVLLHHGPDRATCRYWALNSNHEMYSGGFGYFELTLPSFDQPASYFNLGNKFWKLIGLDSAYKTDHGLVSPQKEWLNGQFEPNSRAILMSHHQPFSAYDRRADGKQLWDRTRDLAEAGQIYGWFFGHEHKCLVYEEFLAMRCRCIGHGAIPFGVPFGNPKPAYPLREVDERLDPSGHDHGINGFALLRFDGPELHVEYRDEYGTVWNEEDF